MERSTADTKERSPGSHLVESSGPSLTTVSVEVQRSVCFSSKVQTCSARQVKGIVDF